MRAQLRLLRAGELAVELLRDRELGLVARERALELLAERAPRAVRVEERRLRHVLRVGLVAEDAERVAVDVGGVPLVQALEGAVQARLPRQERRHARVDTHFRPKLASRAEPLRTRPGPGPRHV